MRHSLSNVDATAKTGNCSVCGPVSILYQGAKNSVQWRCYYRARRSNNWQSKYEHPDVHVRDAMREAHGPACDICGEVPLGDTQYTMLHYDHDHNNKKHRGWLCSNCNHGLGKFRDDVKLLQSAINYLTKAAEDVIR